MTLVPALRCGGNAERIDAASARFTMSASTHVITTSRTIFIGARGVVNGKQAHVDMESSDEELELVLLLALRRRQRKKKRSMWVRPIFKLQRQQGEYHNLLQEMRLSDPDSHFRYLRMSKERFDNLLAMVGEHCSTLFNSVYCTFLV